MHLPPSTPWPTTDLGLASPLLPPGDFPVALSRLDLTQPHEAPPQSLTVPSSMRRENTFSTKAEAKGTKICARKQESLSELFQS